LALVCLSPLALAQQEGAQGAVSVHYGIGDHYQRLSVNYETPSWWTTQFSESWGRLVEAGIGATAFTSTRFANKSISTAFQLGDHAGLGFLVAPNQRLGIRYSHFSNADMKKPNPGLDVVQMTYSYQF
jgi:lipid A 3-O-deacylase